MMRLPISGSQLIQSAADAQQTHPASLDASLAKAPICMSSDIALICSIGRFVVIVFAGLARDPKSGRVSGASQKSEALEWRVIVLVVGSKCLVRDGKNKNDLLF
jgi:hypothetical protein